MEGFKSRDQPKRYFLALSVNLGHIGQGVLQRSMSATWLTEIIIRYDLNMSRLVTKPTK